MGCLLCCGWGVACQRTEGAGKLLEPSPGCCPSCRTDTDTTSPSGTLLLPSLAPRYRFRCIGQDLLSHWLCARRPRRCCPRTPWKSFSIRSRLLQSSFPCGKGGGGLASVIDLSPLNEFVLQTPFKMETVASVLLSVREGDFLASIDLKNMYFQMPVHQSSRKLLRFLSGGVVYRFKALCFGLLTAPQVFTQVFAAVSAWAHSHRIRLLRYLDNWLVLASSEAVAKKNVQDLLSLCHSLRIVIDEEKSDLVPLRTANYLGMTIDTGAARIFMFLARVGKFLSVAETFCALSAPPAQLWQVLLGHLTLLERLVPHSRLRMRSQQWHLKTHWSPESDPPSLLLPLS